MLPAKIEKSELPTEELDIPFFIDCGELDLDYDLFETDIRLLGLLGPTFLYMRYSGHAIEEPTFRSVEDEVIWRQDLEESRKLLLNFGNNENQPAM